MSLSSKSLQVRKKPPPTQSARMKRPILAPVIQKLGFFPHYHTNTHTSLSLSLPQVSQTGFVLNVYWFLINYLIINHVLQGRHSKMYKVIILQNDGTSKPMKK